MNDEWARVLIPWTARMVFAAVVVTAVYWAVFQA